MSQEPEQSIYRIISGKLLFNHNNKTYTLVPPKPVTKYRANLLYVSILNDEKYNEWIRAENLDRYMMFLEVWNNEMSSFIERSEKQIEDLKVSLFNNRLNNKMTGRTRNQLSNLRKRLSDLQLIRQTYYAQTLEGYAESIKYEYIITNTLFHNKKKVFGKFGSLQTSYHDFTSIVSEINNCVLQTSDYRRIARSDLWRSFWTIDKNNIFPGPVALWTEEQRTLAGYSSMYDSIYEHPEKPNDSVINDDDMLDGWMISQRRAVEKSKLQESMLKTNSKLGKAQEVFIFTDNEQGIKEVMSMNSDEANLAIAQRSNILNKGHSIDHGRLPDVQKDLLNK
jgi:hypothetical protein